MNKIQATEKMTNSEKEVAQFLDLMGVEWAFEYPVFLKDDKERPRLWTPDFYLPEIDVFVEVCGSEDFDYEYRRKMYDKNKVCVVFVHKYKESEKWQEHFKDKIKEFTFDKYEKMWKIIQTFAEEKRRKEEELERMNEIHMCVSCGKVCRGDYLFCPYCQHPLP